MPSVTPPSPSSSQTTSNAPGAPAAPTAAQHQHTQAALCYAFPLLPALVQLARERRSRFVRLHAAHALLFFALVALGQTALLLVLIHLGNLVTSAWLATALGLLVYVAVPALGIASLIFWLRWLARSLAGHAVPATGLGRAAAVLERWSLPPAETSARWLTAAAAWWKQRMAAQSSAPDGRASGGSSRETGGPDDERSSVAPASASEPRGRIEPYEDHRD